MKLQYRPIVIIEGLDGTGKSSSAQEAALNVSDLYPERSIAVTDSTGFYRYQSGQMTDHQFGFIADLKPSKESSKVGSIARLGAFTLSRRAMDYKGMFDADILLSVRDPHRIDPATYAKVYAGPLGRLSIGSRLALFDRLSRSPPAENIIHLHADTQTALSSALNRASTQVDKHETAHHMALLADELPKAIDEYARLFGAHVLDVEGLQSGTSAEITSYLEPIVAHAA